MCCVTTYAIKCKPPLYCVDIHILHLSSTRDYESQHKMFIIHGKPWGAIAIDQYYKPNRIVGVWREHGLTPSMAIPSRRLRTSSLNFSGHVSSICFMAIESIGIHITPKSLLCKA